MEIWVNPTCSKCAATVELLDDTGVPYTTRRYLDDPPTAAELAAVLDRLDLQPWDIARTNEKVATELSIADWPRDAQNRERWIDALTAHPILIQRPIITADDGRAVVGRSEESVRSILPGHV